jgi:L-fuculose-phosphate aldolase
VTAAEAVTAAMRELEARGLCVGTAGNVSVRDGDRLVISPSGIPPSDLDPSLVSVVDADGRLVQGRPPSSELGLHRLLHDLTGCGAVVHTHAPMSTAIATTHTELPAVHYTIAGLGGPVRVAPYATFGTPELATHVARAMRGRRAALLANHGAVTCGPTLAAAMADTVLLEWLCALYWRALQVGTPRILTDDELDAVRAQAVRLNYGRLAGGAAESGEPVP